MCSLTCEARAQRRGRGGVPYDGAHLRRAADVRMVGLRHDLAVLRRRLLRRRLGVLQHRQLVRPQPALRRLLGRAGRVGAACKQPEKLILKLTLVLPPYVSACTGACLAPCAAKGSLCTQLV